MADPETPGQIDRMKTLMSNYYGVDDPDNQESTNVPSPREKSRSVKDVNSAWFDVELYIADLLKQGTLPQLLDRDEELVGEIKCLDRDVQMLVYDNYSKFIGATDTMRSMKDKLFKMEGEVAGLEGRMETIAKATRRMNERNATKREEIARLDRLGGLVDKLGILFDLPTRLRNATQLEEISEALELYKKAVPFLEANSHIASFAQIKSAANEVMETIDAKLHRNLDEGFSGSVQEFDSLITALLAMDESPQELVKRYVDWHRQTILGGPVPAASESTTFETHARIVRETLLDPMVKAVNKADILFQSSLESDFEALKISLAKDILRTTLERLRSRFDVEPAMMNQEKPEDGKILLQGVSVAISEILSLETQLPLSIIKALRLRDRAGELAERAVRKQVEGVVGELRRRATERLAVLPTSNDQSEGLKANLDACAGGLIADAVSAHAYLTRLLQTGKTELADVASSFQDVFRFQLQDWCTWLSDELKPKGVAVQTSRVNLLSRALVARLVAGKTNSMGLIDAKEASVKLRKASDEGLNSFVTLTGMEASKALCADVETSVCSQTMAPVEISDSVGFLLNEVASTGRILRPAGVPLRSNPLSATSPTLLSPTTVTNPNAASAAGKPTTSAYRRGDNTSSTNRNLKDESHVTAGIQKIFAGKVVVLDHISLDVESIMAASLRVALKTWSETIRENFLSPMGYQQIYVDAHFVRIMAPMLTGDPSSVNNLINEVTGSAKHRCPNAVPLDSATVERMGMQKREKVRLFSQPT